MDAIEISYRLKRLGMSQSDIARQLGITQTVVCNTIRGRISSYRVATHIAGLLGEPVEALWPDRYRFRPRTYRAKTEGVSAMT